MKHITSMLTLLCIGGSTFAQLQQIKGELADDMLSKSSEVYLNEETGTPAFAEFQSGSVKAVDFFTVYNKQLGLTPSDEFILYKTRPDDIGYQHYRYQQYHKGYPVEHGEYILSERSESVQSLSGVFFKGLQVNTTLGISEEDALKKAMEFVGADSYKWEIPENEKFIKEDEGNPEATYKPKASLVITRGSLSQSVSDFKLTYKFDIYAEKPLGRYDVYVDAATGKIINSVSKICFGNSNGSGITLYNGTQSFTSDSVSTTSFRLRESKTVASGYIRKVETYDMNKGTNYSSAVDFTDADNYFTDNTNKDRAGWSAHWAGEATYDYYRVKHSRNSFNGSGGVLKQYVHYDVNYVNAFWDGSKMTYGDGDGSSYDPLVSLDIVGHEISHGVTQYEANLTYANEPGALNESFSDIFGAMVEFYKEGASGDWYMGEDPDLGGTGFRSMSNPGSKGQPDTYMGTNWYPTAIFPDPIVNDNGGVHYNSGVQNFWFYLLSQGGSGTNDNGAAYSVTAIGKDAAAAIAYRNLAFKLTSSSNYAAARTGSINAARDLYGVDSQEEISVTNAWHAVGVGAAYSGSGPTCGIPSGLGTSSLGSTTATLTWSSGTGASSYNVRYKATSSGTWTTTTSTTTSKSITGLTASTTYEFQVQSACSGGTTSSYSGSTNFTTTSGVCSVPTGLSSSSVTSSSATLSWSSSGAASYNVRYKPTSSGTWTTTTSSTTSKNVTGLSASTAYEFQVQSDCSGSTSAYSSSANFTTTATCDVPAGLSASSITGTSATLNWSSATGATSYNVRYKKTSVGSWTTTTSSSTSVSITGLTGASNYEFQVQSACSGGNTSAYSSSAFFSTPGTTYCTSQGNSTLFEYIEKVHLGAINNTSGDNGGYGDYTSLSTNLAQGSTYSITLTPKYPLVLTQTDYWRVWIDYTSDKDFLDVDELVHSGATGTSAVTVSFTVPSGATLGNTRMRVQMKRSTYPSSCETFAEGEVEDYTVNIVTAGSIAPMAVNTSSGSVGNVHVYPNPAKDDLFADLQITKATSLLVRLFDLQGNLVYEQVLQMEKGMQHITVPSHTLSNGVYQLSMQADDFKETYKVVLLD